MQSFDHVIVAVNQICRQTMKRRLLPIPLLNGLSESNSVSKHKCVLETVAQPTLSDLYLLVMLRLY